ncbi:MAG: hypothetical protein ILP24_01445, partial [Paludibacteraceae bacterium]|nr:hypothetical protein [Paludibacteraceae bacterium]
VITKADSFEQAAPEGYKWQSNNDGTSTLVINEEDPEGGDTTGVNATANDSINEIAGYYMLNGVKVSKPNKGTYIVKYANGEAKKVIFQLTNN